MDKLNNLGLSIDEHEQLRIMSPELERNSIELPEKTRSFLASIQSLEERLTKTETLLAELVGHSTKAKIVSIAANIVEIAKSR